MIQNLLVGSEIVSGPGRRYQTKSGKAMTYTRAVEFTCQ